MNAPSDPVLESLLRQRKRVLSRVTWWENHRFEALIPMAIMTFALGFGVGYAVHKLLGVPYPVAYILGIVTLLSSGKVVDRRFSVHRLDEVDARIARHRRTRSRASQA